MVKNNIFILFFFVGIWLTNAQGEANIWYFGEFAGISFNSSPPVPLLNGQINTQEGCASISDANGQLLFYTDGITVFNRNQQVMTNGNGLMGHPSSAQSATIVPKPGSDNLYYIFTTDNEHDPNGFRYSIVDMNMSNGNGAVTVNKNILVYTPTIENLGITKHGNGQDYWIVTHGWNSNSFIAYQLTASGLNLNPVVTNIGAVISGGPTDFVAAGTIKISPSGSKLAFTSVSDIVQLFDFNNSTGVLSNEITLLSEPGELIGAAFSPDESLLYISNSTVNGKIYQFNLNAIDIPNSIVTIHQGNIPGQLQVGPDNKIYIAMSQSFYLGVINNPNEIGLACNFVFDGFYLGGKRSKLGLPSFNQSFFFTPAINFTSNCEGQQSFFTFNTNQTVLSVLWNFGDGTTSTSLQPNHIYANPGVYDVSITIQTPFGSGTNSRQITIFPRPQLTSTSVSLKQCDDNNDGFSAFNLTEANELVVPSTAGLSFSYHLNMADAQNDVNPIINETAYVNSTVNTSVVYVRVKNANDCYRIVTLNLIVSTTLIPASFQRIFKVCDDENSGSNTDGIASFNFSSLTADVQALFPVGQQLVIRYYKNMNDALAEQNPIQNISNYSNTNAPFVQNIYIRVDSLLDNACLGLGHHITLQVEPIPIIQPLSFRECDDNQDGVFGFNTASLTPTILNGISNASLSFWDENNMPLPSPLPNPFYTTTQTIKVRATNISANACYYESTLSFTVDVLPVIYTIPSTLMTVCDDELNPIEQNGLFAFDTSSFQNILLGSQTGMLVNYFDDLGNALPSPLPNPFISGTQNIQVEVINTNNINCKTTAVISFVVHEIPNIELLGNELICSNDTSFTKVLTAGLLDEQLISDYFYQWFKEGIEIVGANDYELIINSEGVYTVEVTTVDGCNRTRTYTVTASNIATIEEIEVVDLSSNNTILVFVSGVGDYMYSLDNEYYQTSNLFQGVEPGVYTVYVQDINGCGIVSQTVSVLGIPKFFTPNGDGYYDVWNLKGVDATKYANSSIFIYDRFGRFLKQISPLGNGWDGTFNGSIMPSSDYWFVINLDDGRTIKGHFALKR